MSAGHTPGLEVYDSPLVNEPVRLSPPPTNRTFYARQHVAMKWTPYKPTSQEAKRGQRGRWQQLRPYGIGWQNADVKPEAGAWIEDVINHPELSQADPVRDAAPELLEACRLAEEYDQLLQSHAGPAVLFDGDVAAIDAAYDKWIAAARAALARARGENTEGDR